MTPGRLLEIAEQHPPELDITDLDALAALLERATIPSAPGYFVTSAGEVWSEASNWRGYGARQLVAYPNSHGYLRVRVVERSGARKSLYVHKLVCALFCGDRPSQQHEVRHLNGNREDNRAVNLAWGTRKENAADRSAHGNCKAAENGSKSAYKLRKEYRAAAIRAIEP